MKIYPYYKKLIRQFEEMGGYSFEDLHQILEEESWKEKFLESFFHLPEKIWLLYRMEGYMQAIKILSYMNMKKMPVTVASEEEKLTEELMEAIRCAVSDTISQFLNQRNIPDDEHS